MISPVGMYTTDTTTVGKPEISYSDMSGGPIALPLDSIARVLLLF